MIQHSAIEHPTEGHGVTALFGEPGADPLVVICTPTVKAPYPAYLDALEASVPDLDAHGIRHASVFSIGSPYISCARAELLRKAMDARADIVVFIDHDLSWDPEDIRLLVRTPGDVVAGVYRFKTPEESYMGVIHADPSGRPQTRADGCIRAALAPAGFLKITKEAVHRFMAAYPELCFGPHFNRSVDLFNHGAHADQWWGEDYAFCRRWTAMGEALWIAPDLSLTHHGDDGTAHRGNFMDFLMRQPGGAREGQPAWWDAQPTRSAA